MKIEKDLDQHIKASGDENDDDHVFANMCTEQKLVSRYFIQRYDTCLEREINYDCIANFV